MATMEQARHPAPDEITLIDVMGALNDPLRVGLVRVLADGREHGWGELRVQVAKSTLSHHLGVLRDAGVTHTRQEGTRCFVALHRDDLDARFPGLLNASSAPLTTTTSTSPTTRRRSDRHQTRAHESDLWTSTKSGIATERTWRDPEALSNFSGCRA